MSYAITAISFMKANVEVMRMSLATMTPFEFAEGSHEMAMAS
jgi:hypothetical protein